MKSVFAVLIAGLLLLAVLATVVGILFGVYYVFHPYIDPLLPTGIDEQTKQEIEYEFDVNVEELSREELQLYEQQLQMDSSSSDVEELREIEEDFQ
ncbi:MAG: hypothetical protein ABEJ65_03470 [bacterium]